VCVQTHDSSQKETAVICVPGPDVLCSMCIPSVYIHIYIYSCWSICLSSQINWMKFFIYFTHQGDSEWGSHYLAPIWEKNATCRLLHLKKVYKRVKRKVMLESMGHFLVRLSLESVFGHKIKTNCRFFWFFSCYRYTLQQGDRSNSCHSCFIPLSFLIFLPVLHNITNFVDTHYILYILYLYSNLGVYYYLSG
jgi:hypothetical protein